MTKPSGLKLAARPDSAMVPAAPARTTLMGTVHAASELLQFSECFLPQIQPR